MRLVLRILLIALALWSLVVALWPSDDATELTAVSASTPSPTAIPAVKDLLLGGAQIRAGQQARGALEAVNAQRREDWEPLER